MTVRATPVRQQYLRVKRQHPDAIVFFRLGDFYETFDDDARVAARELDLVLTSRPVAKGQRVPMAGVPYHAVEGYIARLIQKGYKVAICEQTSEQPTRGLMDREVVRVVTPGTVVEPALLQDRRNNYLAAVVLDDDRAGLAYADVTTGEFATTQLGGDDVLTAVQQELARLQPAEVLVEEPKDDKVTRWQGDKVTGSSDVTVSPCHRVTVSSSTGSVTSYPAWHFELDTARRALLDHFEVASLEGFGCDRLPLAIRAAGAIVQYLAETQKGSLGQLAGLATYSTGGFMALDAATRRNLELTETIRSGSSQGSLLGVLDQTVTAMGGRRLRQWLNQPLLDIARLNERLDQVQVFYDDTPARTEVISLLKPVSDIERLTNRIARHIAGPRDLLGLKKSLEVVPKLQVALAVEGSRLRPFTAFRAGSEAQPEGLKIEGSELDPCQEVVSLIGQAISPDAPATLGTPGVIAAGFSAELDGILATSRNARQWVAGLERRERERTGIKTLKVGYNKVFGYYLEVSNVNADRVPSDYIRKQTLVNAERYITPELKEYESLILNADERIAEIEARIFRQVCDQIAGASRRLLATARALAHLDVVTALAEVALRNNYARPTLTETDELRIVAGRHPVVELSRRDEPFVPNDVHLGPGEITILTGPNMSGKSTFLRQVAIIVLMAQIGSFVPADAAQVGLVDRIFTRIGAQDEISAGQSTFMVEMIETANILNHATGRSVVILDEIGRGTSTYDGISIAWAVVEHLHNHPRLRPKTLFATHYHELTELARLLPRVRNYNVAVSEEGGQVVFLHKIVPGGADRSYGIHVAQLAGLPRPVIHRAEEILQDLEGEAQRAPVRHKSGRPTAIARQLALFPPATHPAVEALKTLDVASMTPLEAINKLFELQRQVLDSTVASESRSSPASAEGRDD
jgi:DNA mismatch repair protein MutS